MKKYIVENRQRTFFIWAGKPLTNFTNLHYLLLNLASKFLFFTLLGIGTAIYLNKIKKKINNINNNIYTELHVQIFRRYLFKNTCQNLKKSTS